MHRRRRTPGNRIALGNRSVQRGEASRTLDVICQTQIALPYPRAESSPRPKTTAQSALMSSFPTQMSSCLTPMSPFLTQTPLAEMTTFPAPQIPPPRNTLKCRHFPQARPQYRVHS